MGDFRGKITLMMICERAYPRVEVSCKCKNSQRIIIPNIHNHQYSPRLLINYSLFDYSPLPFHTSPHLTHSIDLSLKMMPESSGGGCVPMRLNSKFHADLLPKHRRRASKHLFNKL